MVHQKQTRQVEGEFDMEIVSLIVQQLQHEIAPPFSALLPVSLTIEK